MSPTDQRRSSWRRTASAAKSPAAAILGPEWRRTQASGLRQSVSPVNGNALLASSAHFISRQPCLQGSNQAHRSQGGKRNGTPKLEAVAVGWTWCGGLNY
jgi:hypothetical protein